MSETEALLVGIGLGVIALIWLIAKMGMDS